MTADFARVRALFEAACDLDDSERARFLERECGGDAELRAAVEQLFAGDLVVADKSFLAAPIVDRAAHAAFVDQDDPLGAASGGAMVGGFRVLEKLASGGMGTVYVAEQSAPQRKVALKVLKPAYASDANLRRFQVEAEILGRLKHDGIAEIHGAGVHAFGAGALRFELPWYAMEYLEGAQPLTVYARDHALDLAARFRLFAEVCDAVAYAHGMGVIHRDLKPANVLVGRNGRPKIIDFGIAREVAGDDASASFPTRTGELMGTLRYMAPEQVDGDPAKIDVRTDVYALGVMLYELLTGRVPHDLDGRPITDALRVLREHEPSPPSRIDSRLAGEPEWIVLRAIEKDKTRRYASAAALREDVLRFLQHEALEAGPPSGFYRARKFVRRHRVAVGAASAVIVALGCGLVATGLALKRALLAEQNAKDEAGRAFAAEKETRFALDRALSAEAKAKDEADVANRVVAVFQRTFEQARHEERGLDLKVVDALDMSADSVITDLKDRPDLATRLMSRIARLYTSLGDDVRSRQRHEDMVRLDKEAGIDLTEEGLEDRAGLIEMRMRVADFAGTQALIDETRALLEPSAGQDDLFITRLDDLQGRLFSRLGKPKEAEPYLRKAAETRERVLGFYDEQTLSSWNVLNVALQDQGRFAEAEPIARQVLQGYIATQGPDQTVTQMARANLAALLQDGSVRKYEEARDLLIEALRAYEKLVGLEFPDAIVTLNNLASVRIQCHEEAQAAKDYATAIERATRRFGAAHPLTVQITTAASRFALRMGETERSEAMSSAALAAVTASGAAAPDDPYVAALHTAHAEALRILGQKDAARAELAKAIPILRAAYGDNGPETRLAMEYLKRLDVE